MLIKKGQNSFFLHLRPGSYRADTIGFSNTFFLGFLCFFFLAMETVTGFLLMAYYSPSPETAYLSIIRLHTEIPFGWLIRDLHRLGGELMIIVVALHMIRIILSGSYRGSNRAMTWVSGMGLFLCTLFLAFSGYLLPWDQLAYWAVTIGTSLLETLPFLGSSLASMLKGGPEIGKDGLLRFYLLHIAIVPGIMILLSAAHYYRISRLRGPASTPFRKKQDKQRISFFPDLFGIEIAASLILLTLLTLVATFFYDAPLGTPANPSHTPAETQAPWYFLWLQGALKVGDSLLMGVFFPTLLLVIFTALPFLDRTKTKNKPSPIGRSFLVVPLVISLTFLSFLGLPDSTQDKNNLSGLMLKIAPEESPSIFHDIGFENLPQGIYDSEATENIASKSLESFIHNFSDNLKHAAPGGFSLKTILIVEDWQAELKKITVRIIDNHHQSDSDASFPERIVYVHKMSEK